jgi:hypothetical protein
MIKDAKFHSSVKDLTAPPPVNQIDDLAVHLDHVPSVSPQTELDQKTAFVGPFRELADVQSFPAKYVLFSPRESPDLPSRPGEFHPEPHPDLNLSIHSARAIARRLPPSIDYRVPPVIC